MTEVSMNAVMAQVFMILGLMTIPTLIILAISDAMSAIAAIVGWWRSGDITTGSHIGSATAVDHFWNL
jgi:uncharacterized membrane protein